jgi:ribosomal protein L29
MSMGQSEGLKKYRELRKDRARMRTVLGERARSEQKGTK